MEIEDGTYPITCLEVHDDKLPNPQFGSGDIVRLILSIDNVYDAEGELIQLDAIANRKMSPKSKLMAWAEAFGLKPELGTEFETEQLIGMEALAIIRHEEKEDGSSWPKIKEIVPVMSIPKSQSIARPDGRVDFTAFWKMAKEKGLSREQLTKKAKGRSIGSLDATELAALLGLPLEPDDIPFE